MSALEAPQAGHLRVVVTYLEMTAPPVEPPPPCPDPKAVVVHAERPTRSFYRYLYDTVGEPWLWGDRRRLAPAALDAILQDPRVEVHVLTVAGVPAGYAELDRRGEGGTELAYFGLVPDFIGRRLGPWFLRRAIDLAWAGMAPGGRLTVNTCTLDHPTALGVYRRAGFAPVKEQVKLWPDPRLDGTLPRSTAPQHPLAG